MQFDAELGKYTTCTGPMWADQSNEYFLWKNKVSNFVNTLKGQLPFWIHFAEVIDPFVYI